MSGTDTMLGGRYRIDGLIGRGGMATVWRAHDTVLDRDVAVKRLHGRLHGDHELEERFRREGRLVANLSHPNLVRLLDQGGDADEPFLVFELVNGQDLKTLLRQHGRMAHERAASVCAQVARALAVAHRAGVVHRDIKSHNVLVTTEGVAKLTDFGIARIVEADGDLTRTGIVIGSSDYLSPEQAEGKPLDGRSDIYSLGVVLFEALTGRLPFTGENPVSVATKHVYEDPPDPRRLAPDIPDELATTCLRALAKDPRDRFTTGDALADALEGGEVEDVRPLTDHGETTSRMKAVKGPQGSVQPRRRRIVAAIAGVAVVAVAGVLAPTLLRDRSPETPAAADLVPFTAAVHDPSGDNEEHDEELPNLTDSDPATMWTTETYSAPTPTFGKDGVGLRLTLTGPQRLRQVRITSPSTGAEVQILGQRIPGQDRPAMSAPVTVTGDVTTVAMTSNLAQSEIIIWFTKPGSTEVSGGGYRVAVGKVELVGAANTSQ